MQVYPPEAGEQGGKPRWVELVIKEVGAGAECPAASPTQPAGRRRPAHTHAHTCMRRCADHALHAARPAPIHPSPEQGTYGSIEEVKDLRDRLKLGDVVEATGHAPSGGHELQAVAVTVVVPWRRGHPGRTFVKRPAPPHAAAAEPRALPAPAQQQQQAADGSNAQLQQPGAGQAPALPVAQGMPDAAAAPPARLCKYFVNTGRCAKACCPFTHEQTAALRQRWIKDM